MKVLRLSGQRSSVRTAWLSHGQRGLSSVTGQPEIYDVVTVGGGPVGLALVAALKSSPITRHLRVALVESQPRCQVLSWRPQPGEYANRTSSLTPSSVAFLDAIGAWKHVDQSRVQPYNEMQVWDGSNGSRVQFDWGSEAQKYNSLLRTVATMTENANLSKGLLSRTNEVEEQQQRQQTEGTTGPECLMFSSTVTSIENGLDEPQALNLSSWPVVSVSSGERQGPISMAARLLVGADGASSPVRTFAGIPSKGWDYNRHGVVATINTGSYREDNENNLDSFFSSEPPRTTAYQRFLPAIGGPIALLPLPQGKASLVWSTTPAHAAYLKSLPLETFTTMVNAAFRLSMTDLSYMFTLPPHPAPDNATTCTHAEELTWRLQHTPLPTRLPPLAISTQPSTPASFPLRFRQSSFYTSPRIALIGDAAHTIHPLAGQGLNLGLGDANALCRTIEGAVLKGQDLGDKMMVLGKYERERWGMGISMGGACDLLHKVYGLEGDGAGWGRGVGMALVDRMPWIKALVMRQAEGR